MTILVAPRAARMRGIVPARDRSRQQQSGGIGDGDQQYQCHRGGEQLQPQAKIADRKFLQVADLDLKIRSLVRRRRVRFRIAAMEQLHLGACGFDRAPRR